MAMSLKRHSTIVEQPKQSTTTTTTASLGHHRRRSDALLSHPIISRSIQDLHNQTRTTIPPTKPISKLTTSTTTTTKNTKSNSFSAFFASSKTNIHLPTVTINHGLPSPPTSTIIENGCRSNPKSNSHVHLNQQLASSTHTDRTVTASRPTNLQPALRSQSSRTSFDSTVNCASRVMKPSSHRDSPIPTQLPKRAITTTQPRVSASLGQSSKKTLSTITQPSTISSQLHRNSISKRSSTVDGPMPSRSSNSESINSPHFNDLNQQDHGGKNLSTSLLSNATIKPHRSSSGSSSIELRGSKLKAKDRSKDQSTPTLHEETHNLPRSKRLIGMKERNERIFASINASLNSPPRTHPPEPSLPPPPPSTSPTCSDSPPLSPPISSPKRSSGNLRVPGGHDIRSGLIPFAKGCSPSPRKIATSTQPQASNGRMNNPPLSSISSNPDGTESDDYYGSVRHKRLERSRLIKRNSPEECSEADLKSSPHSQGGKMVGYPDRARRQTYPKTEQLPRDTADPPESDNITNSHRSSRTWSESISMHTSSSDTIDARDNRTARRNASRSSAVDRETGHHSHQGTSMSCEDNRSDGSDYEHGEDETMTTPVKTRRSESYQKTLRNANSVSEMLNHRNPHDTEPVPVGRTPRASRDRRRRSSSLKDEEISHSGREPSVDSPPKSSPNIHRSPQSHASISRRQRPGLPEHFVPSRHDEPVDSETIHSMADIRRLGLHSSRSPRSNRTQPPTNIGDRSRQNSDYRSYRHSDTIAIGPDRLNGVESALSCYDRQNFYSGGTRFKSVRNKHASWSGLDDVGGDLVRSQSVLAGVYDPYTAERRGNRTRTAFPSPISRRTAVYHRHGVVDDDDDGQTSTTTYTNTQSMPRKAGSAESRSRTSEWALEDQHNNLRSVRASSRLGGHANSLIMSPSRCRSIMERDRTLRGNGGGVAPPPPKPFAQLLRNTYQDKNSPNQSNGDSRSSSSGASSKLLQQSQRTLAHRHLASAKLSDSVNRSSRPPTRATTSAASGLTALLSPTPTVEHHRLLISAYEALDRSPDDFSPEADELNFALNALLSSVVKNSCKIDATLAELNESSLNHQVEMELVDDYMDSQADETHAYSRQEPPSEQVNKQKYRMMEDSLTAMSKVQAQLVRSSNDQIRDLTEVLICFSKLQRCQKEQHLGTRQQQQSFRIPGSDDTRDPYGHGEVPAKDLLRSGSRASHRFSHSYSPSKLRHTIDLSPLSVISSNDESPLSRVKANNGNEPSHHSMMKHSGRVANSPKGFGPQHHRASTISFTHNRELSFEGVPYQQGRTKNRVSAMSSTSIRQMGESFYDASHGGSSQSRRKEPHPMDAVTVDEFGLYRKASEHTLRSPAKDSKDRHARPESAWSRAETHGGGHAMRGSSSSVMFPKTPPRLPTSSISQATAHSNVSPTNPSRHSLDGRSQQRLETKPSNMLRPQSSMSKILHRANSVLSRVEHYPVVTSLPSGRKQTQEARDRPSREPSMDESRGLSRRVEPLIASSQQQRGLSRSEASEELEGQSERYRVRQGGGQRLKGPSSRPSSSTATAALERLSRLGTHGRASLHGDSDVEELMSELPRSSTSSYHASGPSESDGVDDRGGPRRHRIHHSPDQSLPPLQRASTLSLHDQINHNHALGSDALNPNLKQNSRRRKGSIHSLFGGLKRSAQAKR